MSIDYLNPNTPIASTSGSKFFDDLAEHWQGTAETVFDLTRREAIEQAQFAYRLGRRTGTNLKAVAREYINRQPTFTPTPTNIDMTAPIPVITDVPADRTDALMAIWDSEGERPVADLTRRTRGFKFRVRQAFWAIVDTPRNIYEAVTETWNAVN